MATFADDTTILATHKDHAISSTNLQATANKFNTWAKRWKIKTNNIKSVRIDFTLRPHPFHHTTLNDDEIPISTDVKYLGVHLDKKLKKREEVKLSFRSSY